MQVRECAQCFVPLDADEVQHCKACVAESLAFEFDEEDFRTPYTIPEKIEGDTGEEQDPD